MKAPSSLSSAIEKAILVAAFLPLVFLVYPESVAASYNAQNSDEKALVFEVNSKQKPDLVGPQEISTVSYEEIAANDPLVTKVQAYLEAHNSPLAPYAAEIVQQPQWQRALAISYVESSFAIHCANNNCSGIGGSPHSKSWRKYPSKLDWFKDMTALLETPRYKEQWISCQTMNGHYNAGSQNWLRGCMQKSNELLSLTAQADQERIAMAQERTAQPILAATASVELAK